MLKTSRSESMNSFFFFDNYVNVTISVKEFIENSQKVSETQYLREIEADYITEYKQKKLIINSALKVMHQ